VSLDNSPFSGRRWTEVPELASVELFRPEWQSQGACAGTDPADFFPERGAVDAITAALAVCSTCTVTAECLAYALENNEAAGVWGNTTPNQRRKLRKGRGRNGARCGTRWAYRLGCRCDECREANATYQAKQRRRSA
jgi:WhiB family redox-sensing transcriptional regulator